MTPIEWAARHHQIDYGHPHAVFVQYNLPTMIDGEDARPIRNALMTEAREWAMAQGYDFLIRVYQRFGYFVAVFCFKNENDAVIFKTGFG